MYSSKGFTITIFKFIKSAKQVTANPPSGMINPISVALPKEPKYSTGAKINIAVKIFHQFFHIIFLFSELLILR